MTGFGARPERQRGACIHARLSGRILSTALSVARADAVTMEKNLLSMSNFLAMRANTTYVAHCPISHVPVAVCRSVGIRTRGRTAARSEIARSEVVETNRSRSFELRNHLTGSRRRNRRTPLSTGDAA
jgi:hypothetical protein